MGGTSFLPAFLAIHMRTLTFRARFYKLQNVIMNIKSLNLLLQLLLIPQPKVENSLVSS